MIVKIRKIDTIIREEAINIDGNYYVGVQIDK